MIIITQIILGCRCSTFHMTLILPISFVYCCNSEILHLLSPFYDCCESGEITVCLSLLVGTATLSCGMHILCTVLAKLVCNQWVLQGKNVRSKEYLTSYHNTITTMVARGNMGVGGIIYS